MGSSTLQLSSRCLPISNLSSSPKFYTSAAARLTAVYFPSSSSPRRTTLPLISPANAQSPLNNSRRVEEIEEEEEESLQPLRVPDSWLLPSKALEESQWLRVALHKWLDDEYCPEETNIEISKVAAKSFYKSLLEKRTDLGEILLSMARELESISYQDSFHGAFSSANAAVELIAQRIDQV